MDIDAGKDFFISYTSADKKWAEWIAWQLETAQYSAILQAWDFQPGMNFVLEMDKAARGARCTIVVLSPDYLSARYTQPEWAVAFRRDPKSEKGALLPVRVQKCEVEGLLGSIVYIDLVDLDEATAHETLLVGVRRERVKPETAPGFPGEGQHTIPEPQRFPGALPPIWNIPYPRNPYFTGRKNILKKLYDAFRTGKTAAIAQPQAISGLGGIGKTQIAVEYAYRYSNDYQAVLWVRAETRELLISDFVAVAGLLNLPEKDVQDQNEAIEAVKRWLKEHKDWLLILDNADDLAMVHRFLPFGGKGHILLTTRAHATGRIAQRIKVEKLAPEEGALFLLHRATILDADTRFEDATRADQQTAVEIVQALDGLPLALDQAGAYIEETSCGLLGYLDLYRAQGVKLLKERGGLETDYPESVAWWWRFGMALLAFKQGDYPEARTQLEACLSLFSQWEYPNLFFVTMSLDVLGEVATALGEPAWVARLWGAAQSMRTDGIPPLPPVFRSNYEQCVTIVRDQLGEEAFQAALAEGRTMTPEKALAVRGSVTFTQPLASGPTAAPRAKSPQYQAGLTVREVEVLRLVAQWLTDAQVAAQLVISPRTVNTHLTSIYNKLGINSRAAAAHFAVEQRLA